MRGTPTSSESAAALRATRQFARETILSSKADEMIRFSPFVEPGSVFPYEGTLHRHSMGSYIRGNWMTRREDTLRTQFGLPPLPLDRATQKLHHGFHDFGEHGLARDPLAGMKSPEDRIMESKNFIALAGTATNLGLHRALLDVHDIAEHNSDSVSGRFGKRAVEHIGNLETARRLHLQYVRGQTHDEQTLSEKSGIYLGIATLRDASGNIIPPRLIGTQALIADILANSGKGALLAADEFLSAREYLWRHADQFQFLYSEYLLDESTNTTLFAEITLLKDYTAAAAARMHGIQTETALAMPRYLDYLSSATFNEAMQTDMEYSELIDGESIELTG